MEQVPPSSFFFFAREGCEFFLKSSIVSESICKRNENKKVKRSNASLANGVVKSSVSRLRARCSSTFNGGVRYTFSPQFRPRIPPRYTSCAGRQKRESSCRIFRTVSFAVSLCAAHFRVSITRPIPLPRAAGITAIAHNAATPAATRLM